MCAFISFVSYCTYHPFSSTNFMAYTRGAAAGYDAWAKIGNIGWDWKSVFPYFKKVFQSSIYMFLHGLNDIP